MEKAYEVVLVDLNNGTPSALVQGVEEIVVRVKAGDAESAIKVARKVITKDWGYKVALVAPIEQSRNP
jgi:hypothetical protein